MSFLDGNRNHGIHRTECGNENNEKQNEIHHTPLISNGSKELFVAFDPSLDCQPTGRILLNFLLIWSAKKGHSIQQTDHEHDPSLEICPFQWN